MILGVLQLLGCASGTYVPLTVEGTPRNYYVTVPKDVTPGSAAVLVFHGGGPEGARKGRRLGALTGFADLAVEEGFIAAYPSSYAGNWDDGRDAPFVPPEGVSDLAFVDAVVEDLVEKHGIDRARVYATGISNGGFFTNHLACQRTSTFAAFGNVIGGMPVEYACTPEGPAPMLLMPGTADPLVPYEGGAVASSDGELADRGALVPQEENQAFWAAYNGCPDPPVRTDLPDVDPDDGSTVHAEDFAGCADGASVRSVILDGGGHGWPGGSQYLPRAVIGPVNQDIQAEDVLWAFFAQHVRSESP